MKYKEKYYLLDYSIFVLGIVKCNNIEGIFTDNFSLPNEYSNYEIPSNCKTIIEYPFFTEIDFSKLLNNDNITFDNYVIEFNENGSSKKVILDSKRIYSTQQMNLRKK